MVLTIYPSLGRAINTQKVLLLSCIETGTGLKHGEELNGKWTRKRIAVSQTNLQVSMRW